MNINQNNNLGHENDVSLNINLNNTEKMSCDNCDNFIFANGVIFRKVSKLLSGTSKDGLLPITIPYCVKCRQPLLELLPIEIKDEYITSNESNIIKNK